MVEFPSLATGRISVHFNCKMAQRKMIAGQLNERRVLFVANFFRSFTTRREWTTRGQVREVRRLTWNLVEFPLLSRRSRNRPKQPLGIRIPRAREKPGCCGLL